MSWQNYIYWSHECRIDKSTSPKDYGHLGYCGSSSLVCKTIPNTCQFFWRQSAQPFMLQALTKRATDVATTKYLSDPIPAIQNRQENAKGRGNSSQEPDASRCLHQERYLVDESI